MKTNKEDPDFRMPVAWLIEDHMEDRGYDKEDLSEISKIPLQELNAIMASSIYLTEQAAIGLQIAFGMDKEVWLAVDEAYWRDR